VQPVAFTENHEGRVYEHDYIGALNQGGGKPGMCYPAIRTGMSVRRLTPTECERLQGFPDGWTQIPWKKKAASECPDGPRYKALGNSMAVNCMRWIGRRIELVEKT
jgi:DNA (cytosine-5)-methyltransferase 1